LIKHLVSVLPDSLEQKSAEGFTPLQVAVYAEQLSIVSYLISCGANQRHRDKFGRNMVHSLLVYSRTDQVEDEVELLQSMLKEFEKEAVKEMLVERCNQHPGALTPLAYWMAKNDGNYVKTDIIEALSKYSSGEELEMINGEGDLPLHVVCCEIRFHWKIV
jgi:ankyrin repeat protein